MPFLKSPGVVSWRKKPKQLLLRGRFQGRTGLVFPRWRILQSVVSNISMRRVFTRGKRISFTPCNLSKCLCRLWTSSWMRIVECLQQKCQSDVFGSRSTMQRLGTKQLRSMAILHHHLNAPAIITRTITIWRNEEIHPRIWTEWIRWNGIHSRLERSACCCCPRLPVFFYLSWKCPKM